MQLLLLSTPLLLFMGVPYTEALFFCFGSLLLLGLRQRRMGWWVLGLLGCGLTRSASSMFTPGLLFMTLLWASQPGQLRTALRWGVSGLAAVALSIGIVATTQWYQTGEPWAFALAHKHWGHVLQVPQFPWHATTGIDMLWLDALALWIGAGAIGGCCWLAWRWLRHVRKKQPLPILPLEIIFTLGYCVCISLFIVLYQGGNVANAARYLFATPFFVVLVAYLAEQPAWPWHRYLLLGIWAMLFWQVFGLYTRSFDNFTTGQALWYFGLLTAYLLTYLAWRQLHWRREATMVLYVFNLVMLLHLLESWLQFYVVE